MGHILLISNNEVINNVYSINLKAYVGANVTVKESINEAKKLLEVGTNLDLIIAFSKIGEADVALDIYQYLQQKKIDLPLVVVGKSVTVPPNIKIVSSMFDIKSLVRSVAKIFEITARDMAKAPVPDYFPLPIKLFLGMSKATCDVYYRLDEENLDQKKSEQYIKMWEKGGAIAKSVEKLIQSGMTKLYIASSERLYFINNLSSVVIEQLERTDLPLENKIEVGEKAIELVANKLTNDDIVTEEVMKVSIACVKSMKSVIEEIPKLSKLLNSLLENKTKYIYLHSVLCAYISAGIIKNVSWGADEHAEKISFVLFFHDIFLVPIFDKYENLMQEDELLFGDMLSEKEKELVLNHARLAGELVSTFKHMPIGADAIIKQHHGTTSGIGFAVNFKDDISPLSKVIIIAEEFVSDILKARFKNNGEVFNREESISRLRQKYTKHTYKKIIDALEVVKF